MSRYSIIQQIQDNQNTKVYQVEDQVTGNVCIQKCVSKNAPYLVVHQFHIEVDILSSLHHPQIPEIMDVYSNEEYLYLIESYIPGKDFSYFLDHPSLFFILRRSKYILELMNILEHIHEIGYLYIDIKPSNLLIYQNHLHLIDFNACIPTYSTQAVFASKQNASSELFSTISKTESTDMYSLGTIVQKVYPFSMIYFIRKCLKKDPNKRFKTWKAMRKSFLINLWIVRTCCVFLILLSVFFAARTLFFQEVNPLTIYFKEQNASTFFNAYQYTYSNLQGNTLEKTQMNLYKWLENGWIDDELWQDEIISQYLLIQGIQSKNPTFCREIKNKVQFTSSTQRYVLLINYIMEPGSRIKEEEIKEFLSSMEEGDIKLLIPILLSGQYVLDEESIHILNSFLEEEKEDFLLEEALQILEYDLFLKEHHSKSLLDIAYFNEIFNESEEWVEFYEMYRRVK